MSAGEWDQVCEDQLGSCQFHFKRNQIIQFLNWLYSQWCLEVEGEQSFNTHSSRSTETTQGMINLTKITPPNRKQENKYNFLNTKKKSNKIVNKYLSEAFLTVLTVLGVVYLPEHKSPIVHVLCEEVILCKTCLRKSS